MSFRPLKDLVKRAASTSWGWRTLARTVRQAGVTVLMYHRIVDDNSAFEGVRVDAFREQMRWIGQNCTVLRPEDLDSALSWSRRERPPVLVTFDDGYRDYYDNALPILRELNIPAIVFLPTSFMGSDELLWTDLVTWAVRASHAKVVVLPWISGDGFVLSEPTGRNELVIAAKRFLKVMPDVVRKERLDELLAALQMTGKKHDTGRQMMTWDEVRAATDITWFGGHSHTHPILSQLDDKHLEDEIRNCRDAITRALGKPPRYFAYPNGREQDFDQRSRDLLRRYGFEKAFATIEGINRVDVDLYAIRRQAPYVDDVADLAWRIAGMSRGSL